MGRFETDLLLNYRVMGWKIYFIFLSLGFGGGRRGDFNAEEDFLGLFVFEFKNTSYDAFPQQWDVEVNEETGFPGAQPEVVE